MREGENERRSTAHYERDTEVVQFHSVRKIRSLRKGLSIIAPRASGNRTLSARSQNESSASHPLFPSFASVHTVIEQKQTKETKDELFPRRSPIRELFNGNSCSSNFLANNLDCRSSGSSRLVITIGSRCPTFPVDSTERIRSPPGARRAYF